MLNSDISIAFIEL